jgi:hypothetical protein
MENYRNYFLIVAGSAVILFFLINDAYLLYEGFYGDFKHFYYAALAMANDENIYTFGAGGYIYPPFFAFLILPLTKLSLTAACGVWQFINLILLFWVFYLCMRTFTSIFRFNCNLRQTLAACSLAVLFSFHEIGDEFKWMQTDLIILLGLAGGLYLLKHKPYWAGICLGIVANIKYQTLFFLPFFLLRTRWRNAAGVCLGAAAGALVPALVLGWDLNGQYLMTALRGMIHPQGHDHMLDIHAAHMPKMLWKYNISITNGLLRIFQDNHLSPVWVLIPLGILAFIFIFIIWKIFQRQGIPVFWRTPQQLINSRLEQAVISIEYLVFIASVLIFSPQCLIRHLILTLPINLFAALILLFPKPNIPRWPILLGVLLVQLGKLYGAVYPSWLAEWRFIGGAGWTLMTFLPLFIYNALFYSVYLYGNAFKKLTKLGAKYNLYRANF